MSSSGHFSPRVSFGMLVLVLVLAALDQTILSTALPVMAHALAGESSAWPLAWVFSAYLLAATVVIAIYGRLADVVGRKPMLLLAIGLFLLGSLACGASQSLPQLVLARACQGAGGGGLMTLTMLTVAELFTPERRGRHQAVLGAAYGISTMFGPLLGAALVEHLSWRWAFWLNVPLAALAWGVLAWRLPRTSRPIGDRGVTVDWLGALLLTGALVCLLLSTQQARLGLPSFMSIGLLLTLGTKFGLAFLWRQRRAAHPLLPLTLFSQPAYAAVSFIGLVTGIALYAAVVFLPQYLQTGLHLSPTASAWHLWPLMAGLTAAAIASGKLLRAKVSPKRLARVSCGLMLLAMAALVSALHWWADTPLALCIGLLPLGAGLGVMFPIITVVAQRVSPMEHMGIATAAPVMLRSLGGAAGTALLAAALSAGTRQALATSPPAPGSDPLAAAMAQALQPVFGYTALALGLALLACRWLGPRIGHAVPVNGGMALEKSPGAPTPDSRQRRTA